MLPSATASASDGERLHALDALRAFAMLLGISLHAAIAFQAIDTIPWPRAARHSLVFDLHNVAIHAFRLQLFFLVAGFFARLLVERRGPAGFIRNRAQRVLLPWLLGMATLVPLTLWVFWFGVTGSKPFASHRLVSDFPMVTAHLWFLEYLLLLYAGALAIRWGLQRLPVRLGYRVDEHFRALVRSSWKPFALALPTLAIFSFSDVWIDIGLPVTVVPMPRVVFYYGVFFAFGWLLHRNVQVLPQLERCRYRFLGMSGIFLIALLALLPFALQFEHPHFGLLKFAAMTAYNLFTWSMIFGITGCFLQFFRKPNSWVRYCADASYWLYLAHLPLVLFLQIQFRNVAAPSGISFLLILGLSIAILFATYHWLVRRTWIGTMLNGRRAEVGSGSPSSIHEGLALPPKA